MRKQNRSDFPENARPAANAMYLDAAMRNAASLTGSRTMGAGGSSALPLPLFRIGALVLAVLHIITAFWVSSCISRHRAPDPIPARATVLSTAESLVFLEISSASRGVGARFTLPASTLQAEEGDVIDLYIAPGSYRAPSNMPGEEHASVDVMFDDGSRALRTETGILIAAVILLLAADGWLILRRIRRRNEA